MPTPIIHLNKMPEDVRDYVVLQQAQQKIKCKCTRSLEFTIYALLREHRELQQQNKFIQNLDKSSSG